VPTILSSLLSGSGETQAKGDTSGHVGTTPWYAPLKDIFISPDLRRVLPWLMLSTGLINLLALALPLGILQIMDRVVSNQVLSTLIFLVIGILAAMVLEEVLRAANSHVTGWLGARFEHAASVSALTRLMYVPLRHLQREEPIAHAERVSAATKVAEFYSGQSLLVIFDLPFALLFLFVIYLIGGWLVLVPLVLLLVFIYIIIHFGDWLRLLVEQRHIMDDRRSNFLVEVFTGIHSVKTLMMEAQMERRYELLQDSNSAMSEKLAFGSAMASATGMLFSQIMIVGVVFGGAWGVLTGQMTPGGLAACMMLSVRALQPLRRSLTIWLRYQTFVSALARLQEVVAMPVVDDKTNNPLPPVRESLELKQVSLYRSGGTPLFAGLSLTIRAGECVGIRGDSGSGKSSLLSLLNGMDQPESGTVLVDGRPLGEFSADSVQRQIAMIPQNGSIVAGTILQNMTMFDDALNSTVLDIASRMGLDRVVAGLKLGYETPLGEGNAEILPTGVRQLITIVRALARNPSVIVFDEANISLDLQADQLLRDYLAEQKGKCILILVTHRPSLLALADRMFTLSAGQIKECSAEPAVFNVTADADKATHPLLARPEHVDQLSFIVHQHFNERSDFSYCLLPLLKAMQWRGLARDLAEAMPHMLRRLDLSGFCTVMANLGLLPSHFRGSLARLDQRLMPCLYVPGNRPAMVIIEHLADGRLRCIDGGSGNEVVIAPTAEETEIYLFKPAEQFASTSRTAMSWFGSLFLRFRRHILLAFMLTILSTLLSLAPPLFVRSIYDQVLPTGDIPMQTFLLLGVALALTLEFTLRRLKSRVIAHLGGRTEYIMGTSIFRRVIGLPTASTEGASVNRQVGRMRNFENLRDFFIGPLTIIAFDMPANLIIIVAVAILNPWALLAIAGAMLGFGLLAWATRGISERAVDRSSRASHASWEFLTETITQMRIIRGAGCRQTWLDRFNDLSGKAIMAHYRDHQIHARISAVAQAIGTSTGLAVLAISAYATIQGQLSGGIMIATIMLVWRLTGPMQNFFLALTSMAKIRANMRQIENLMRLPAERDSGVRQTIRPASKGALSFSRVSFRYANDADPALLGVNFSVESGQMVVITGPNGAGKSTVFKLIERTFIPQAGTIRLDNIDIRQLTTIDLRARLGYMPQSCDMFYGTVSQNLRLVHPAATDEELRWAVEMAGLATDIQALPEGMETRISNNHAAQLPNGFRQKLALARTILKPSAVVMLDEPGTGLDDAGELALLRCIEWLRTRSTLLIISQRPGHMRLADTVIYMYQGAIAAIGPFESIKDKIMSGMRK